MVANAWVVLAEQTSSDLAKAERGRGRELQRTDRLTGPEEVYNAPLPQGTP